MNPLEQYRLNEDLSYAALAHRLGLKRPYVERLCKDGRRNPGVRVLDQIEKGTRGRVTASSMVAHLAALDELPASATPDDDLTDDDDAEDCAGEGHSSAERAGDGCGSEGCVGDEQGRAAA